MAVVRGMSYHNAKLALLALVAFDLTAASANPAGPLSLSSGSNMNRYDVVCVAARDLDRPGPWCTVTLCHWVRSTSHWLVAAGVHCGPWLCPSVL